MNTLKESRVLVTGAFDIMHIGHIRMLEFADTFTNYGVIVMIDDDERIKQTKGEGRPYNSLRDRREFLLSLRCVAGVLLIKNDLDIIDVCKQVSPIRVVGGDWRGKPIVGGEFCKEIKYFDRIPGYSTTDILIQNKVNGPYLNDDKLIEKLKQKQNLPKTPLIPIHSFYQGFKKLLKKDSGE